MNPSHKFLTIVLIFLSTFAIAQPVIGHQPLLSSELTYTWSNGSNGPELIISPAGGTSYSVTGTDANACSNSAIFV